MLFKSTKNRKKPKHLTISVPVRMKKHSLQALFPSTYENEVIKIFILVPCHFIVFDGRGKGRSVKPTFDEKMYGVITTYSSCFFCIGMNENLKYLFYDNFQEVQHIIVEMSSVSYIDSSAGKLLVQLYKDYNAAGISFSLAASSGIVYKSCSACMLINT